jgi:hypothetical protein
MSDYATAHILIYNDVIVTRVRGHVTMRLY